MQERVRICDIAEELGLSTATVSNVIHGKTNKVSDETVQRVMALLEKRQYIPSMAGILLAQNSSGIIGVFVNDHPKYAGHTLRDGFIAASLDALSTEIEAGGQFMMVKKAQCAGEVVRFASMWNMDGIVMIGFCEQDYMDLRRHIRIPIAVYDGLCGQLERMLNLSIDNYGGGYLVGCHFRELGHRAERTFDLWKTRPSRHGRSRCGNRNGDRAVRQFPAAPSGIKAAGFPARKRSAAQGRAAALEPVPVRAVAAAFLRGELEPGRKRLRGHLWPHGDGGERCHDADCTHTGAGDRRAVRPVTGGGRDRWEAARRRRL